MDKVSRIALAAIAAALVILGLKFLAYGLTGSVALYSDAMESIVNVAAAVAAFIAVRVAAKPADRNHPFGHHKAEYLSAVLEGVLIVLAALAILYEAWQALLAPRQLQAPALGLAINGLAGVLNFILARLLLAAGRRHQSPALVADGRHLMADVWSSVAVILGVGVAVVTGWLILDALLAAAVALVVLASGWTLVRDSIGGLMDAAPAPQVLDDIRALIAAHGGGALQAHDLRTRRAGQKVFVEFHLVVPGTMAVSEAHEICDRLEAGLKADIPGAIVTIHVEPEDKAKRSGAITL